MLTVRKKSRYDKISFLTKAPEIELQFLMSKEEQTNCYRAAEGKLYFVRYIHKGRQVWTEHLDDGYPRLEHISMKRVMQLLSPKEKKELIENWSMLKGESPPKV